MEKKTKQELLSRNREILRITNDFQNRELSAEEKQQNEALCREFQRNLDEIALLNEECRETAATQDKGVQMRELLQGARRGEVREIVMGTTAAPGAGLHSGAVDLTIKDLVPNLEEGTGLPAGATILAGVTGDVVFPTDASDMELTEAGEVAVIDDQTVDFDNVKAAPARVTLSCDISNKLIDNLHFNILAYIQGKFNKAWRKYLATKVYSQANFAGIKGGFAGLTKSGDITIGGADTAKQILKAVAAFVDKGFDINGLCLVLDATTEAILKVTPVAEGQGGFCIQNGKLLGYDYVVSHRINTALGGDAKVDASHNSDTTKLFPTTKKYLGIGFFQYLPIQQHGEVRLSLDATSKAQQKKNCVGVVFNTEVSITNLSNHIYDENGNKVSAFAVYELADATDVTKVSVQGTVNTKAQS